MSRAAPVSAKLCEADAVEIVRRYRAGEAQHVVAAAFRVNPGRVSEIIKGKLFPRAREIARRGA
ncbi:MAG: hypothetical protein ABL883_01000 [Terricaulis sp.]